jgi:response regulator RpfG family c-di-GMP phosphodiesterase
MPEAELPRILCVDDEAHVLEALRRSLRTRFNVAAAGGGQEALERLATDGPFAVIVSDMRMPGMDGATLLRKCRETYPDTTRVLLTGHADLNLAIAAVNDGHVFRFLTKPCSTEVLTSALDAAAEHYHLLTVEKDLLERTLRGSVKSLMDVLALANPDAFGRASRVQAYMIDMAAALGVTERWPYGVAGMLSQLGCITLPAATTLKMHSLQLLDAAELAMVARLPEINESLIAHIPRLEPVCEILRQQNKNFDGTGLPADGVRGAEIPLGARILRAVLDFDTLESAGVDAADAMNAMRGRIGYYDPDVLRTLAGVATERACLWITEDVPLGGISDGMVFAEDIRTRDGRLLISRGQEVTGALQERLRNHRSEVVAGTSLRMMIPPKTESPTPGGSSLGR